MFEILVSANLEITSRFYAHLAEREKADYQFTMEKHGNKGVAHHAASIPNYTVEIYPQTSWLPREDCKNFLVQFPEAVKAELISHYSGQEFISDPMPDSKVVILRDPDGRAIRLLSLLHLVT